MSLNQINVEALSSEILGVRVTTPEDPTDSPVYFNFAALGTAPSEASWVVGTWFGTWDEVTKRVVVLTPTLPSPESIVTLAKGNWVMWVKWTSGVQNPVKRAGYVAVT